MALYASHARGTRGIDLATLGTISAPQPCLAPGQLHIASGTTPGAVRPATGRTRSKAVRPPDVTAVPAP